MKFNLQELQKRDWVLIAVIICVTALALFLHEYIGGKGAGCATVKVKGEIEGVYSLAKDQSIEINGGTNVLKIRNGSADMTEADCPDKYCVDHKPICRGGETIICLPHRLVVEVTGTRDARQLDVVVP